MDTDYRNILPEASKIADQIRREYKEVPRIGYVLGSGWGDVVHAVEGARTIAYSRLQGMPRCGVEGHAGNFVFGKLGGEEVVIQQGRFHMYEGHPAAASVLPVGIMKLLGVEAIVLTNAAGGVNTEFSVGDLMILEDHINLTNQNPLVGACPTKQFPVFVDMTHIYDSSLSELVGSICSDMQIPCRRGVYLQVLGPSFETPAEIRAFRTLGADAVGMSTAIEAIYARYLKLRVVGISCITNMAAGISGAELKHADVLKESKSREQMFSGLLKKIAEGYSVIKER